MLGDTFFEVHRMKPKVFNDPQLLRLRILFDKLVVRAQAKDTLVYRLFPWRTRVILNFTWRYHDNASAFSE